MWCIGFDLNCYTVFCFTHEIGIGVFLRHLLICMLLVFWYIYKKLLYCALDCGRVTRLMHNWVSKSFHDIFNLFEIIRLIKLHSTLDIYLGNIFKWYRYSITCRYFKCCWIKLQFFFINISSGFFLFWIRLNLVNLGFRPIIFSLMTMFFDARVIENCQRESLLCCLLSAVQ